MKRLSDMLRNDPTLRCVEAVDCLEKVKNDQHIVYLNVRVAKLFIKRDIVPI